MCFCYAYVPVTFLNGFGVCFWMSGTPESSIWLWECCKNQLFANASTLLISVPFSFVFYVLGSILMILGGLETGLKFYDFRWLSGGPWSWGSIAGSWYFGCSLGHIAVTKQYGVTLQHAKYIVKPAGIKGYEKTRMQITKIRKIMAATLSHEHRGARIQDRRDASQPVAPLREAGGFWVPIRSKTCHLACLPPPFWHLLGPSSDFRTLVSTRKEALGCPAWISIDSGWISGPNSESF